MKLSLYFFYFIAGVFFLIPQQVLSSDVSSSTYKQVVSTIAVVYSTTPIGSPFVRHLAHEYNVDLKMLDKYQKRGFGRAEMITLLLISEKQEKSLKDIGNLRLKEKKSLRQMVEDAGMNYDEVYKVVYEIKKDIEALGEQNLPPPVFEALPAPSPTPIKRKKKKEKPT